MSKQKADQLREIVTEIDGLCVSEKQKEELFRSVFSTGSKRALKRGETWRGRVLQWIAYEENPPKDKWHVQRIAKKQAGTRIYYHVTFASKLSKILMDGIVPTKKRVWGSKFGEKLGVLGRVYCWRNYEIAYRWAYKQAYDFKKQPIIVAFREHYSKIHEESILFGDGKQYYKVGSVKPEQITDVYDPIDERVWKR